MYVCMYVSIYVLNVCDLCLAKHPDQFRVTGHVPQMVSSQKKFGYPPLGGHLGGGGVFMYVCLSFNVQSPRQIRPNLMSGPNPGSNHQTKLNQTFKGC